MTVPKNKLWGGMKTKQTTLPPPTQPTNQPQQTTPKPTQKTPYQTPNLTCTEKETERKPKVESRRANTKGTRPQITPYQNKTIKQKGAILMVSKSSGSSNKMNVLFTA